MNTVKFKLFKKIYALFSKKKFNFYNSATLLIVIIFAIPLRFLKLFYFFLITNKSNFRDGLEVLYVDSHSGIKNFKIEILNGKIYLNGYSLGQLIKTLKSENSALQKEHLENLFRNLKQVNPSFMQFEFKDKEYQKLYLTRSWDFESKEIYSPHYAYNYQIHSFYHTIHATSKIPRILHVFQKLDIPMPSAVLANAQNPASTITTNINKLDIAQRYILVPKWELDSVKYSYPEIFSLDNESHFYIKKKNEFFEEILKKHLRVDKIKNYDLIKNLRINNYKEVFENCSIGDFGREYDQISPLSQL